MIKQANVIDTIFFKSGPFHRIIPNRLSGLQIKENAYCCEDIQYDIFPTDFWQPWCFSTA